jgi:hypothetical protein
MSTEAEIEPNEPEPDRGTRRLINDIADLRDLEAGISQCRTVEEVEEIRRHTMGIQTYYREHPDGGQSLVLWAKRVACLCQLQITKIQVVTGKITGKLPLSAVNGEKTHGGISLERGRLLNSLPPEELTRRLDKQEAQGKIEPSKLAEEVRAERKAAQAPKLTPPKTPAAELARKRERYAEKKAEQAAVLAQRKSSTPFFERYRRYWTQEKELLVVKFNFRAEDLAKLVVNWNRDVEKLRMEAEAAEAECQEATARLKSRTKKEASAGLEPAPAA